MADADEVDSADVIRVLVATDNHLGYAEKDPIRGDDSFIAFEEILELAVSEDVDFILLGGDLFHEATPSPYALNNCLRLLRRYTLGDKPITIEFLSDQSLHFHDALNSTVNYEDPNINISIPVFSIHGNHDDPSGFGRLSSLDLLANTSLINYFGRWTDLTKIVISPILLRKGATQLAIFGLSHIHDARLARLFEYDKVTIERPDPSTGEWFSLMVLHQNRADRGPKNFISEDRLPDFLHLIIWGHEHDCHTTVDYNPTRDFYVYQPGSSVATSLADGEALPKHVGLLEIYKTKFQIKPLRLQTVRPFIFESVTLSEMVDELHLDEGNVTNKVMQMAKERVEAMLELSKTQLTGHPKQPTMPLIRLRIVFTEEEQMFNAIRFGQQFNKVVANPNDIIHFKKVIKKSKKEKNEVDNEALGVVFDKLDIEEETRVEELVDRYFEEVEEKSKLKIFSSQILSETVKRMVDQNDVDAADKIFKFYKDKAVEHLMERLPNDDEINVELSNLKVSNSVTLDVVLKMLDERGVVKNSNTKLNSRNNEVESNEGIAAVELEDDAEEAEDKTYAPISRNRKQTEPIKRGRGRARGTTASNTSRLSKKSSNYMPKLDISVGSVPRPSGQKQTLLDVINQGRLVRQPKKARVFEISDESE